LIPIVKVVLGKAATPEDEVFADDNGDVGGGPIGNEPEEVSERIIETVGTDNG
jgi:hypothetical protein